jgi:hypothetical protein
MTPDLGRFPHHPLLALDGIIPFQRGHCCRPKGQLSNNASKCYCGQATLRGKSLNCSYLSSCRMWILVATKPGAIACQRPALRAWRTPSCRSSHGPRPGPPTPLG